MKKLRKIKDLDFYVRMFVIVLSAIMPLILLLSQGHLFSISKYWNTPMQPLFIMVNAMTSFYLFSIKNWKLPAVFLLLLTAFSVEYHHLAHNILAIIFFVVSLIPLKLTNHYKAFFWIYLGTLPVMLFDMFLGESLAVFTLCFYHGIILWKVHKLTKDE